MNAETGGNETTVVENTQTQKIVLKKEEEPKEEKKHYLALKLPKKVKWSEDTVDNEGKGKKKSKICCIYHKPKLSPDDPDTSSCDSCDEKEKMHMKDLIITIGRVSTSIMIKIMGIV